MSGKQVIPIQTAQPQLLTTAMMPQFQTINIDGQEALFIPASAANSGVVPNNQQAVFTTPSG